MAAAAAPPPLAAASPHAKLGRVPELVAALHQEQARGVRRSCVLLLLQAAGGCAGRAFCVQRSFSLLSAHRGSHYARAGGVARV
jgi:hypothetical protein